MRVQSTTFSTISLAALIVAPLGLTLAAVGCDDPFASNPVKPTCDVGCEPDYPPYCPFEPDANPCTEDICHIEGYTEHRPITGTLCDDNDACTATSSCQAGVCAGPVTVACNEGEACSQGFCMKACPAPLGAVLSVEANPMSIVGADLNGDGADDILVGNADAGTVSVLFGAADGTFAKPVIYATGATAITAADLNGDGRPDLAAGSAGNSTAYVFLNQGDGQFAPRVGYPTTISPVRIAAADVNGDGWLDLVAVGDAPGTMSTSLSILFNKGDGTFEPNAVYAIGIASYMVIPADINGDGAAELLVSSQGMMLAMWSYDGAGGFIKTSLPLSVYPNNIVVADLDGDLDVDVGASAEHTFIVLRNDGAGALTASPEQTLERAPTSLIAADVSGDGFADLAAVTTAPDGLHIVKNNGDGTFGATVDYITGARSWAVAAGDWNGDGKTDLAVTNRDDDTVSVYANACLQ